MTPHCSAHFFKTLFYEVLLHSALLKNERKIECVCLMTTLCRNYCMPSLCSFFYICRFIRPEEMDDEVTQIFKKWKLNNPTLPKKDEEIIVAPSNVNRNETFDTRTFTRPPKRRTFISEQQVGTPPKTNLTENDMQSIESGVCLEDFKEMLK